MGGLTCLLGLQWDSDYTATLEKRGYIMKRLRLLILVSLIFNVAVPAGAAVISYAPGDLSLTVSPGDTVRSTVMVSANTLSEPLLMMLGGSATGNLPEGWVTVGMVRLLPTSLGLPVPIKIRIPPTALPGIYSGRLVPQILRVPLEQVNSGKGVSVKLIVVDNNKCTEPPMLKDVSVGPQSTLIPNGKETTVWVSGVLEIAEGCTLQEFVYDLNDEYGVYSSTGPIVADETGSFKIAIQIEASRRGQDKDGRLYSGTLTATGQEAGMTRASFSVKVEHDMGKGKDK